MVVSRGTAVIIFAAAAAEGTSTEQNDDIPARQQQRDAERNIERATSRSSTGEDSTAEQA